MKLVYKCLHCGAAKAQDFECDNSPELLLDIAYGHNEQLKQRMKLGVYQPHECQRGIVGVAQLVAVIYIDA